MSDDDSELSSAHRALYAARHLLVHDNERLTARILDLEGKVQHLQAGRSRLRELVCDNCRASLTVCSSVEMSEEAMRIALGALVWNAHWCISQATADELRVRATDTTTRDLCPKCVGGAA